MTSSVDLTLQAAEGDGDVFGLGAKLSATTSTPPPVVTKEIVPQVTTVQATTVNARHVAVANPEQVPVLQVTPEVPIVVAATLVTANEVPENVKQHNTLPEKEKTPTVIFTSRLGAEIKEEHVKSVISPLSPGSDGGSLDDTEGSTSADGSRAASFHDRDS
jgi:hypothetical protein